MTKGVSEAVGLTLDEMGFLRMPLKNDLVNYSALARFILPSVNEKLEGKKSAGMDAVIMAVRRYAKTLRDDAHSPDLFRFMGEAKIAMRTGMAVLHFSRSSDLYSKLVEVERSNVNWHQGDRMYIIQRSEEIMAIVNHKLLQLLHATIDRDEILAEYGDLAIITVEYDEETNRVPGVVAFIANQLAAINVNMMAVFNSITKLSMVVEERHASKAYEKLRKAFEQCKQAARKAGSHERKR